MPGRNLMPILFPQKKKTDDVADMLNDLVDILVKGYGSAPSSEQIDVAIAQQEAACAGLTGNKLRTCIKKILDLKKQKEVIGQTEKKIGAVRVGNQIESKLTDLEYAFANDPYHYIDGKRILYRQASYQMDKILQEMPEENYKNYTDIQDFINLAGKYETEAADMNEILTAMKAQNEDYLKYAGIFYKVSPKGEVKEMSVGFSATSPSNSIRTNIKTPEGLPVYIINPKAPDEVGVVYEVNLGRNKFTHLSALNRFDTPEPDKFDWSQVKHREITSAAWGEFLKDNSGQKYFITKDLKAAPVNDDVFRELGGNETKLQKVSGWEEENILPKITTNPIKLPTPKLEESIRQSIQSEYEAEKAKRQYGVITPALKLFGKIPAMPTREEIEARIRGKYGISRYLPLKEKEAIRGRTEEIFKGGY